MILSELTTYLAERKRAALIDLAYRFGSDPEALRGMLAILERKGRARKLPTGATCGGGCNKCDPASLEIYEWVEPGPREAEKCAGDSDPRQHSDRALDNGRSAVRERRRQK